MKENIGKKSWIFPMPVLMIGTCNEYGTSDMMNAAWGGITLEVVERVFSCGKELM